MSYTIRRRPHPFWSFYARQELAGTPLALQELLRRPDGAEARTSHVGREEINRLRAGYGFGDGDDETDWPVEVVATLPSG